MNEQQRRLTAEAQSPPDDRAGSVSIVPYKDGPLLVRGDFRLLAQDGSEIQTGRRTVALCRCGKSRIRPFCDGTHQLVRFRAAAGREGDTRATRPPAGPAAPEPVGRTRARAGLRSLESVRLGSRVTCEVETAHCAVRAGLADACFASDYLRMRLAEPYLRSALALLETRHPGGSPCAPFLGGDPSGVALRLILEALDGCTRLAESDGDPLLETVVELLQEACRALQPARGSA